MWAALLTEVSKGRHYTTLVTVAYLFSNWIAELERKGRSPNTVAGYRHTYERNIKPTFENVPVAKVNTKMLTDLYGAHQRGRTRTPNRLSDPRVPLFDVHAGMSLGLARLEPRGVGGAALDPQYSSHRAHARERPSSHRCGRALASPATRSCQTPRRNDRIASRRAVCIAMGP